MMLDVQDDHISNLSACHVISCFRPLIGGAERATENLCRQLRREGVDALVLTRHYDDLPRREHIRGIPVWRLGMDLPGPLGALTFILHALGVLGGRCSSYPLVHVQEIDSPLLIGMLAKLLMGKKLVVTLQGEKKVLLRKAMPLGPLRVRAMTELGDEFVAITEETRRQLLAEGIAPDYILDIPNGIDTDHFRPAPSQQKAVLRRRFGYDADDDIVLYAGRLVDLKRVDLLIEAWPDLPRSDSYQCIIVGDGPERKELEALVTARGLVDSVRLAGPTDDVLPYYQIADIFVLPSLYEGLSVALLEAMACGLCVVVAGSPGNLAVVEPGENGLVFPVHAPERLRAPLAQALDDAARRKKLGEAARRTVARTHSSQAVAKAHLKMYTELVSDSHEH